jgi:hypothetical protein
MIVRTPPVQIYTSTLHRRDRLWGRSRGRRRRRRTLDVAALALSLVIAASVVVAILAPAAS